MEEVLQLASRLVEARVRRYNGGSEPRDRKVCGATEVVYVRLDLIDLMHRNPGLASFAIPAYEFEQFYKTKLGFAYISAHHWKRCTLQSILG